MGINQNITERSLSPQHVNRSDEKCPKPLVNVPDVTWTAAEEGRIIYISPNVEELSGYTSDEILASPELWCGQINPEDSSRVLDAYHGLFAESRAFDVEYQFKRKDGQWIWINERAIRSYERDGIWYVDVLLSDITAHKRAELALSESENRYRLLFEGNLAGVFRAAVGGKVLDCNQAMLSILGYDSQADLLERSISDIFYDAKEEGLLLDLLGKKGSLTNHEIRLKRKDGSLVWALENVAVSKKEDGELAFIEGTMFDISKRKKAEEALKDREDRLRLLLDSTAEAIYGIDVEGRCTFCNSACVRMLGYKDSNDLLGKNMHCLIHHSRVDGTLLEEKECRIFQAFKRGQDVHVDDEILWKADGTSFPVEYWSYPQRTGKDVIGAVVTFTDITDRKVAEQRIHFLAYYDALTGLPNRTLLQDRIAMALASARRREEKVALLFLDLDQFKTINDSLGHSVGDLLLKQVAERLKTWTREQDTVARLGGDEFLVLLTALKETADAALAAERIVSGLTAGFTVQGRLLNVSCSVGISVFPDDGTDVDALVKNADAAMYAAKENGRNNFQLFTQDINANVAERLMLENSLRGALERDQLFLVYQPQVDITTGRIIGSEALLRWQHPELGLIPPDKFIPIAENSGLIIPIGEWVLRTVCGEARRWQEDGLPAMPVAVNVSPVQFRQKGFLQVVKTVLCETGLSARDLELEITERLILSNADVMLSRLRELRDMGLRLSIDDFGTGYASLSYLRYFPVYKLKIDRSFVREITLSRDAAAITGTIIAMAKSLDLKVIAEGVESEEQVAFLREHGCDEMQGYYFSKPLHGEDFVERLRKSERLPSPLAVY